MLNDAPALRAFLPWAGLLVAALAALLVAEYRRSAWGRYIAKPITSTAFVLAASAAGAMDSRYGQMLLVALVLSWLGDVLLLSYKPLGFLAGLGAFLCGHLAFAWAFWVRGVDWTIALGVLAGLAVPGVLVGRWLLPQAPKKMRVPVAVYMTILSCMVALASATVAAHGGALLAVAAVMFYFSDLAVALDRFVRPGFLHRSWGLPLYYGAQILFASTVLSAV